MDFKEKTDRIASWSEQLNKIGELAVKIIAILVTVVMLIAGVYDWFAGRDKEQQGDRFFSHFRFDKALLAYSEADAAKKVFDWSVKKKIERVKLITEIDPQSQHFDLYHFRAGNRIQLILESCLVYDSEEKDFFANWLRGLSLLQLGDETQLKEFIKKHQSSSNTWVYFAASRARVEIAKFNNDTTEVKRVIRESKKFYNSPEKGLGDQKFLSVFFMATLLKETNLFESATRQYEPLRQNSEALYLLALTYFEWHKTVKDSSRKVTILNNVKSCAEELIQRDAKNFRAYGILGDAYDRLGRNRNVGYEAEFDKSQKQYEQAIAIYPDYGPAFVNLANLYHSRAKKGEKQYWKKTKKDYLNALQLIVKKKWKCRIYANLADVLSDSRNPDVDLNEALNYYSEACSLCPEAEWICGDYVWTIADFLRAGNSLTAIKISKARAEEIGVDAVNRNPMNEENTYALLRFYTAMRDTSKALKTALKYKDSNLKYRADFDKIISAIKQGQFPIDYR